MYDHFETDSYTINDNDQAAFTAWLRDTAADDGDDYGLFFHDPQLGTFEVLREGDRIDGIPVVWVWLSADEGVGSSGLGPNQVAYRFLLADDRQGVAVWTAP